MKFNKRELAAIASQPSQNFDKEGVLIFKERQDGFFRRMEVCALRRYRLRGNLLFYFRGPEQWSEPAGVIVLENHTIKIQNQDETAHWGFHIVFQGGISYKFATLSLSDRDSLVKYLKRASFDHLKSQLSLLNSELLDRNSGPARQIDINIWRHMKKLTFDLNEVPMCELALSCDNLLCFPHGRPPSAMIVIHAKLPSGDYIRYANTEVIDSCSNPSFLRTIMFRENDGLMGDTLIRITVYDIIEKLSQTSIPLGFANVLLSTIQDTQRLRTLLNGCNNRTVGFVTINGWRLEPSSTNGSPVHTNGPLSMEIQQKLLCHKRSHSLPPRLGVKLKLPSHGNIMKNNFINYFQASYRFHSGLGGDITVYEIMAESKLSFQLPIQLLNLYIQRELELLNEILCIGELGGKWKYRQIELLNTHLYLLKYYSHASQSMQRYIHNMNSVHFKKSSERDDSSLEFAPVNLHLQRMWAYNDTLNKCDFHDIITVGAFTAHTHAAGQSGGLIRLVQQVKEASTKVSLNTSAASKVQMASDAVHAIKQLRKEIFAIMAKLLSLAKIKEPNGMIPLAEEMVDRTRTLLTLWDPGLVEEALNFIEWHKVSPSTNSNTENASQIKFSLKHFTQHLNLLELCNHDIMTHTIVKSDAMTSSTLDLSDLFPTTPVDGAEKSFDIKENELQFHNYHFENMESSSQSAEVDDDNKKFSDDSITLLKQSFDNLHDAFDCNLVCANNCVSYDKGKEVEFLESEFDCECDISNCYQSGDEPEPWDLTQLNIEASVMCLVSKVKFLCGRCGSPAVRLRNHKMGLTIEKQINEQLRQANSSAGNSSESDKNTKDFSQNGSTITSSLADTDSALVEAVDSVKKLVKKGNKFTDGLKLDEVRDWSEELQPSMRKLKQAMDGLLKTGRLTRSALQLKCEHPHRTRALTALQMRRDTCFSQALTAVTTGLMCWLWSAKEDFIVSLLSGGLGPLCGFEGLLTLYETEIAMWGDMVVAIEDLQTVLFMLTKSNHSTNLMPKIIGSRCAITVLIPVSDSLYAMFSGKESLSFTITAVFFNIGINQKATIAEENGDTLPQEQSNTDNFDKLNKYYHKYKKIFPIDPTKINRSSSRNKPLEDIMENLRIIVHKKLFKNIEILHLASQATRLMNGVRLTSCKSAKDRTGMSATLEQCSILASEYHMAEHEFPKALDVMRSEGCRRENVWKNIGCRKYAFNKLQVAFLPKEYRPPTGTYSSLPT